MVNSDILLREREGTVARLTLNRPEARNALSLELVEQLISAIHDLGSDRETHVVILSGSGDGFCSGHDLNETRMARKEADGGRSYYERIVRRCSDLNLAINRCPKPVIAQVHGVSAGAGAQLVAICDLVVADSGARFCTPGVHIGLFCSTPMVALSRKIERRAMLEMLLTGDMVDAATAREIGLVNRVVPPEELASATTALAQQVAGKAPKTLKIGKEAFYRQAEMPLEEAFEYATRVMVANLMNEDAEEGIDAFAEKRDARWQSL